MRAVKRECPIWLLLAIMFFSQNVRMFNQMSGGTVRIVRDIAQLMILFYLVSRVVCIKLVEKNLLKAYFGLILFIMVGMLVNLDFSGIYWILECTIAFLFINIYDYPKILIKFEKIMFCICLFYTSCYLIVRSNLDVLNSSLYRLLEEAHVFGPHSQNIRFYIAGSTVIRSTAYYREPGIYQIFIICALIIELLAKRPKRISHILLYCVSVLTTYSTTGYICLFMALLAGIVVNWNLDRKFRNCVLFGSTLAIPFFSKFISIIASKFFATGGNAHSWMSRSASIWTNLYFWVESPLVGVGLKRILNEFEIITSEVFGITAGQYSIKDDTNTVLLYFAAFGVFVGVLFIIGQWKGIGKLTNSKIGFLLCFLILICLYAGEAVNSTCLPYIIFFIGFSKVESMDSA